MDKNEKINPIVITNSKTGEIYTLEFSRASVKFAEARGVSIDSVKEFPYTYLPELFYCAFRKNHQKLSKDQTDRILFDTLGGLTQAQAARLMELFVEPSRSLIRVSDEDDDGEEERKNEWVTVEM